MPTATLTYPEEDCWCNHIRTNRCHYRLRGELCKFYHVDEYAKLTSSERTKKKMRGLMVKHKKGVKVQYLNDLQKCIQAGVTWTSIASLIESVGWDRHGDGLDSEEDSEAYVVTILKLVVHTLHYDVIGAADVMFRTIAVLEDLFKRCLADNSSSSSSSSSQSCPPSPDQVLLRNASEITTPNELSIPETSECSSVMSCTPECRALFENGDMSAASTPSNCSLVSEYHDLGYWEVFLVALNS